MMDVGEGIEQLSRAGFSGIMLPPDARIRQLLLDAGQRRTAWAVYNPPGYAFDHDPQVTEDAIRQWAEAQAKFSQVQKAAGASMDEIESAALLGEEILKGYERIRRLF